MGIESHNSQETDPHLAFEVVKADFLGSISLLSELIGSSSDLPPEAETALEILRDRLDTYATAH